MFLNESDTDIYLALQTVFECLHWYYPSTVVEELHLTGDTSKDVAYILNEDMNSKMENHHSQLMNALIQILYQRAYDPILLKPEEKLAIKLGIETIKTDPVIIVSRMINVLEFAWNNTRWADSLHYIPNPWRPDDHTPPPQHFNYAHFIEVLKNLVL